MIFGMKPELVSVFVVYQDKFLVIKRCSPFLCGTWQMVTGGIEPNEVAWMAALREVHEETGIIPDRFYCADTVETFYMVQKDKIFMVPVFVAILDEPQEVVLSPREHDAYEWLSKEEAKNRLVWIEQRRCIDLVYNEFIMKKPSEYLNIPIPDMIYKQ